MQFIIAKGITRAGDQVFLDFQVTVAVVTAEISQTVVTDIMQHLSAFLYFAVQEPLVVMDNQFLESSNNSFLLASFKIAIKQSFETEYMIKVRS